MKLIISVSQDGLNCWCLAFPPLREAFSAPAEFLAFSVPIFKLSVRKEWISTPGTEECKKKSYKGGTDEESKYLGHCHIMLCNYSTLLSCKGFILILHQITLNSCRENVLVRRVIYLLIKSNPLALHWTSHFHFPMKVSRPGSLPGNSGFGVCRRASILSPFVFFSFSFSNINGAYFRGNI